MRALSRKTKLYIIIRTDPKVSVDVEVTYSNDVEEANYDSQDSRSNKQTPERQTQRFLTCGLLVHVSQHVQAEHHHGRSQRDEAMAWAEQRPVARKVAAEEGAFGYDEEY